MSSSAISSMSSPINLLLSALPKREYKRLLPHLEDVPLSFKDVLNEPGQPATYLYFPTHGMISLILPSSGRGGSLEVGVVGREGMVGLSIILGVAEMFTRCMVQVPGEALRIRADTFRAVVSRDSALHQLLLRYVHFFLTQLSQRVACNALHSVEKRLCYWLLTVRDRANTDHFPLTHQFLAAMMGVRRASVTEAARRFRKAGMIRYGGGQLTILNRHRLEKAACGCYRIVKTELSRLLG